MSTGSIKIFSELSRLRNAINCTYPRNISHRAIGVSCEVRTSPTYIEIELFPVTGRGGLLGCEMLRIPHCVDNRLTDGGQVVSLTRRPRSTLQKHIFISVSVSLLEAV
jgi:hypothetical protein